MRRTAQPPHLAQHTDALFDGALPLEVFASYASPEEAD
jgi:hypothetical protein